MNILVTGGASGLGKAIVKRLATVPGNAIFFTYSKSMEAANLLEAEFQNTKGLRCDFLEEASLSSFIAMIPELDIDVLVNNASTGMYKNHFYNATYSIFQRSFDHNVLPILRITQEVIRLCRKKKFGKVINILSSAIVNKPPIGWSEYVANKEYLLAMSKAWATENIKFNITSNAVSPSFMQTQLTSDTDTRVVEEMIQNHPLRKLLQPEEVADVVYFFTTVSQQVNAAHFVINAGSDIL